MSSAHAEPGPVVAGKRSGPRAPLLTQVEAQGEKAATLGRASDISVGGLLIETPDTLAEGHSVVVRFFVPPEKTPIETAGRVARCVPGESMAIAFLGLPDRHRQRIVEYIQSVQGTPAEPFLVEPDQPRQRRSVRIPRRVSVVLSWQDEEGHTKQEAAETQRLSRHGAMVLSFSDLKPGQLARVSIPDTGKEGLSRVVYAAAAQMAGRVEVGIEFMGEDNVWGIPFAPDELEASEAPKLARRRSARLPRHLDVVLNWVDERGRVREEEGRTQILSRHGVSLATPVELAVHQRFRLRVPEMSREVESRVVWAESEMIPGRIVLGVEFLNVEDFWGIPFPSDPGTSLK